MAQKSGRRGRFDEAQAPFAGAALDLGPVFVAYGNRCAFTGADLSGRAASDPLGVLLDLAPAAPMAAGRLIPAMPDAAYAYERGHLALGSRFEFLVALDRIDPELLERLNPIGRLAMPADPAFAPDSRLLKAHREQFAEGLIE